MCRFWPSKGAPKKHEMAPFPFPFCSQDCPRVRKKGWAWQQRGPCLSTAAWMPSSHEAFTTSPWPRQGAPLLIFSNLSSKYDHG